LTKLTQPLGSSEARGKLGGLCYNTWRGISYVKTIKAPGNQNTPRRLEVRALTKACTLHWQAITDADRAAWNHYATLHLDPYWTGNPKRNSGYNWFVRANFRLLDLGLSIIDTPPTRPNQSPLATLAATVVGNTIVLDWTLPAGATAAELQVDIYYTSAISAGRQPKLEGAKHKVYVAAEAGTYTTPSLMPGNYGLFARTIDESTGLASPWSLVVASTLPSGILFSGPKFPTLGISVPPLSGPWTDPELIYLLASDTATITLEDLSISDHLFGSHFDFHIPLTATIVGVFARAFFTGWNDSTVSFQLREGSFLRGVAFDIYHLGPDPGWISAGSASDLWGAILTPAIVNADVFGLDITVLNTVGDTQTFDVDVLELTVYYTP
jgi:hypothetical protein